MAVIELRHVSYLYGAGTAFEKKALDDVSLSIEPGELVGVIGHTGSGKSTLLQHFNGLLKPTSGQVLVAGKDIWSKGADRRAVRFAVGLVFQYPEYQLFEETVARDIAFGPRNMGLSEAEVRERVEEAADFAGVKREWLELSPFSLSGGQKRRVAIAGVMALRPKVLILDEPAAGLDPRGRDFILSHVRAYQKAQGNTVLLVSHSMEDIAATADRVLVMDHAKPAMLGTVPQIFARAKELAGMRLDVPQVTQVFLRLREKGFDVRTDIYTVAQGKTELLRMLGEAHG